jgi:transcriptional regulator with XRE-family HTH domain
MTTFSRLMVEYGVSHTDLMEALKVTPKAVRNWRDGSRQPTPDNARLIESKFGIPKHRIRPDIWDDPAPAPVPAPAPSRPSRKRTADAST